MGGGVPYALSCNLSDSTLVNRHDLPVQSRNGAASAEDDGEDVRAPRFTQLRIGGSV